MGSSFKMNQAGMKKLEAEVKKKTDAANVEANRAAERESTPEGKARAYCRVMKRHGFDLDQRDIAARFRAQMG